MSVSKDDIQCPACGSYNMESYYYHTCFNTLECVCNDCGQGYSVVYKIDRIEIQE